MRMSINKLWVENEKLRRRLQAASKIVPLSQVKFNAFHKKMLFLEKELTALKDKRLKEALEANKTRSKIERMRLENFNLYKEK